MTWQFYLIVILVTNVASLILVKTLTDKISRKATCIFYQFLFCDILAILYAVFSGGVSADIIMVWVAASGVVNALGGFCYWKATNLNLSKTSLFLPLSDLIPAAIAFYLFNEGQGVGAFQVAGAIMCFISMWLFRAPNGSGKQADRAWFYYLLGIIIIHSVNSLLLKLFSFSLNPQSFFICWYSGSLIGTAIIMITQKENPLRISRRVILPIFPLSLIIMTSLLSFYQALQLGGPLSLILPVRGAIMSLFPIFIGWFFFHERERLTLREYIGFGLGIAGVILVL